MTNTTLKLTKSTENEIVVATMVHLLKESGKLNEASLDWLTKIPVIGKIFDKEQQADDSQGQGEVKPSDINSVNIPVPYPEDKKKDILKNPEVKKLLAKFNYSMGIDKYAHDFAKVLIKYPEQVDEILNQYMVISAVENTYTPGTAAPGNIPAEAGTPISLFTGKDSLGQRLFQSIRTRKNNFKDDDEIKIAVKDILKDLSSQLRFNGFKVEESLTYQPGGTSASIPTGKGGRVKPIKGEINVGHAVGGKINAKTHGSGRGITDQKDITRIILNLVKPWIEKEIKKRGRSEDIKLKESLSINNLAETDIAELINEINKFYPYAKEYLGFDRPVELTLISDPDNAKDTFGKTAYYSPANEQMTIFVDGRHPKDIIRSFSHELVHHAQNCRGEFDRDFNVGENYIETDDHLREMEREAYDKGNMCLRTYESYLKKENKTMNEETLRKSIREAIKRVVETKTTVAEEETVTMKEDSGEEEAWHQWKNEHADDDHIKEIEHHLRALKHDRDHERDEAEYDHDKYEDEGMDEGKDAAEELGDDVPHEKGLPSVTTPGKEDFMKEEWGGKTGNRKTGKPYTHEKDDTQEEEDKSDYEKPTSKAGKKRRKKAGLDEADVEEGKDWGANKTDYHRRTDKAGVRKKTGDVGGGKYGKGGHYKDDEMDESQETPLHESMAARKGQIVFDKLVKKWCK